MGLRFSQTKYKELRRELRKNPTKAEALLWQHLKGKQLNGYKFRRQHNVGRCILDFYCPSAKLGVELDGVHHGEPEVVQYDINRTTNLESLSVRIIRFPNDMIFGELDTVLAKIQNELENCPPPAKEGLGEVL